MNVNNVFTTKSEIVFNYLKNKILNNELEPGSDLIISKISNDLNVSPIPVREALKSLEMEGLVELEAHKTAKVATINLDKLYQIGTIRAGLEGYAARLAADYITDDQILKLNDILNEMNDAKEKKDSELFNNKNMEFHRFIYKIPPFPMLYDMIINVWDGGKWTRAIFAMSPDRMGKSIIEHHNILNALRERDNNKVELLIREHRLNASKQLEEIIRKQNI